MRIEDHNHEFTPDLRCTGCTAWIDRRARKVMDQRVTFCRLEVDDVVLGWQVTSPGVNLLHPDRYPERMAAKGKAARAVELDAGLQPTGRVWGPPEPCPWCTQLHAAPLDGSCLI